MSDNLLPEPQSSAQPGTPTSVTNVNGGVNLDAQRDVNIGGAFFAQTTDVVTADSELRAGLH